MHKKQFQKIQRFIDVPELQERIKNQTPKSGQYFYDYKLEQAQKEQQILKTQDFHKKYKINFSDLPISKSCIKGLTSRNFIKMTQIQRCVIPHALANRDIMAASRTGSGKTLCYLIPVIQKLYRNKFIPIDGLGAIIIVPVRQLAIQVFQVLNSFTNSIEINVGLIIGGKDVQYQKQKINTMNILICTPGRLLQHLQQTYGFQTNNLLMLVLDQADLMMEMGFENTLKSIVEYLPKCQTMLFSATLNNQVKLLANLSMNFPQKIFLHSKSLQNNPPQHPHENIYQTPIKLTQYYMIVQPQQKINTLFSFIKTHQHEKTIVFISTCKQVRFIYQSFKKFKLGLPMYQLQGHQKQKKRMAIYFTFCQKKYALLLSTNIASRGLDFPMIDWVIQYDIPENSQTYIHRIGRTARFKYSGKSLTFITKTQLPFINQLKQKNINVHKIKQNPQKYLKIQSSLQSICSQHQQIKYLAQRALISYLKFIHKTSNKAIFNINNIDTNKLASSFGLQNAPIIQIKTSKQQQQSDINQQHNNQRQQHQSQNKLTKIQKLRLKSKIKKNQIKQQKKQKLLSSKQPQISQNQDQNQDQNQQQPFNNLNQKQYHKTTSKQKLISNTHQHNQQDNQLFKVKNTHKFNPNEKPPLTVSKNRLKKIRNEGIHDGKNKIHFDDNMNILTNEQYLRNQYLNANKININIQRNFNNKILQNKQFDTLVEKNRRKQKRFKINQQKKIYKGQLLTQRFKDRKVQEQISQNQQYQQEQMEKNKKKY